MKIRVKELTVSDKIKGIKVGDVFEVVESNYGGYYVELENGFIKKVLGNKRYWFLGEEHVKVIEGDQTHELDLHDKYYRVMISGLNTPLYYTPKFKSRNYVAFLPRKVIFNEAKGKTTLLFGEKPYDVVTSVASHGDKFDLQEGFLISMAKFFSNQRLLHFAFGYKNKNQRIAYLKGFIHNELLEYVMSISQVNKLSNWCFDKPITFNINGVEHTIEVEFKNKENKDEIGFQK